MSHSFAQYYEDSEEHAVKALLARIDWDDARAERVELKATQLVENLRTQKRPPGQLEDFMRDYALNTDEGLALMTLAEALLRVPDKATAKMLIFDKVAAANWLERAGGSKDWVVKATGMGLFVTSKTLESAVRKIGEPLIREAMVRAMRVLGQQFVLGRDIKEAMDNALKAEKQGYRMSYDILGEGARTREAADIYYEAYRHAIDYIGKRADSVQSRRPGISVKLSALHPRYEYAQKEICVPEMVARLTKLCRAAASYNIALTVDAEESERLDISLKIIEAVMGDKSLKYWDGFGLAVQAYQKSTPHVIEYMAQLARKYGSKIQMRLVKGAYWDREIKHAQVAGLSAFPVFTRKAHTDLSYITCAQIMFAHSDVIYPMFGTHNAHTIAAILDIAQAHDSPYEFQRLFGMGQGLYDAVVGHPSSEKANVSIYAPVGPHEDLLAYLVRRLLENGANSSFVNRVLDHDEPVANLVDDPVEESRGHTEFLHSKIDLPKNIFKDELPHGRVNSSGMDLDASHVVTKLYTDMDRYDALYRCAPLIDGDVMKGEAEQEVHNPARTQHLIGYVEYAYDKHVNHAFKIARNAFKAWSIKPAEVRALALENAADALELRRVEFMHLLVREAGKTLDDAIGEIREAVDFLRYYAHKGRVAFDKEGMLMPGYTGESNRLSLHGRGTFVCISPWNFPLAIFTGQISAALMAGNCVIAKPAEQTPLVAMEMVELLHEAGVDHGALALLPGDGEVGAALVAHKEVAGVAFTGSTAVAQSINRALAAKDGAIVPFIAETGGQNAMIVDSSALPEQVIDDVILSAFGSAGQRCSALRVLCVQSDIANKIIHMLQGAMAELQVGDPYNLSCDIGPVIDEEARAGLARHRKALNSFGQPIYEVSMNTLVKNQGYYFPPIAYEIDNIDSLEHEVFGPVLHIIRYDKKDLPALLERIQNTGYGLTLGIHSRIQSFHRQVIENLHVGNVYINRSQIGAIVGSQPFGGCGLSGTGPKAGGPHYLQRFAHERVVSIDTTAAGGNASLVSLAE